MKSYIGLFLSSVLIQLESFFVNSAYFNLESKSKQGTNTFLLKCKLGTTLELGNQ